MADTDKNEILQAIVGEELSADTCAVYLNLAAHKMLERLYPFNESKTVEDIPARYAELQCELAARLYLRRGAEGEIAHNENGVNRTYESVNDADLLSRLVPYAKIC